MKTLRRWHFALVLASLVGCASIDFDYPRAASQALTDTSDTSLGRELNSYVQSQPAGQAGFYPLLDGIDALAARLLLAEEAERSIDVQYYLIKNDSVGKALIDGLLRAADRGVRVRLLLDDILTKGYDAGMYALDTHPNFEIRIFNPFYRGAGGKLASATNFGRINRRMHNKSFTVDNQMTVIGGRNIADEYFGAREDVNFGDLDVVAVGPMVQEVSAMFDSYWAHETALPVPAFVKAPEDPAAELERLRATLKASREEILKTRYAAAVRTQALEFLETDGSAFRWAPYTLVHDSPDKGVKGKAEQADLITTPLRESLLSAEREVVIISPYFVPRKSGIEALSELQNRGIDVTIITNSLAANNQSTVHGGYAPARKPLLKNGIKIYEMRADADVPGAEIVAASRAKATLHTKAFIVDREEVFIGSFNFDPRSVNINTELGVIIKLPDMANEFAERINEALASQTYEVFLNDQGKLRWRGLEDGREVVLKKEPQTSWGQRFAAGFMRLIPIRGQL